MNDHNEALNLDAGLAASESENAELRERTKIAESRAEGFESLQNNSVAQWEEAQAKNEALQSVLALALQERDEARALSLARASKQGAAEGHAERLAEAIGLALEDDAHGDPWDDGLREALSRYREQKAAPDTQEKDVPELHVADDQAWVPGVGWRPKTPDLLPADPKPCATCGGSGKVDAYSEATHSYSLAVCPDCSNTPKEGSE